MTQETLLDAIDPEIATRLAAEQEELDRGAVGRPGVTAALALGSIPIALAALSTQAFGQGLPTNIKNVLDFALALEIFEDEFYKAVLGVSSSPAQNAAFTVARAQAVAVAGVQATLQQISKHETAHVAFLQAAGATNVFGLSATTFDFTGNRSSAGGGPFTKATADAGFLLEVAQGAEDTGVRAYKGQAANLMSSSAILEAALRIHSVEARHASRIRRLRRTLNPTVTQIRLSGTVRGGDATAAGATDLGTNAAAVTAAFNRIYGAGANSTTAPSESNTTHAGINVASLSGANFGADAATEAFDEPLDRADVVAIVQPFFIPTIS